MAGPGGSPTKQHPRPQLRPPILAGVAIVLVAAFVIGLIAILEGRSSSPAPAAAVSPPAPAAGTGFVTMRAAATTNVRAQPERFAEVVAILPADREARALGRTSDGSWVRVAYPPDSSTPGWAPAGALRIDGGALEALPVVATGASPTPAAVADGQNEEALPDLIIADAFLLQDGRLAVGIRNVGGAALVETIVPLNVSKVSGDILGVLRIGPTTLAPGASATVVTTVVVTETGSYLLELDRPDEIRESGEFNNSYIALLIAGGG